MVLADHALEALLEPIVVDLGRRDVGVAVELLDGAQVGAAVVQVTRERIVLTSQTLCRRGAPAAGAEGEQLRGRSALLFRLFFRKAISK